MLGYFLLMAMALGQSGNKLYVKSSLGSSVGAKVGAAQAACNLNSAELCILVIDASLATYPNGNVLHFCAHCSVVDDRAAQSVNQIYYAVPSSDLGAQITTAVSAGYTEIRLTPNAGYSMTSVATAGVGVFIDCQGATISADYSLGDLIRWDNGAAWANLQSQWVHAPTGIAHCKFVPRVAPNSSTTMRVGYVNAVSQFTATDVTVDYGGAFEISGPSITGTYMGVRVVDPTTPQVWLAETGTGARGWYGPGGNNLINDYCEGVSGPRYVGQHETCYEIDSGSFDFIGGYMEAFAVGVHVNGGSVTMGGGTSLNLRAFPSTAVQYDSGDLVVNGVNLTFGDEGSNADWGFVFNCNWSAGPVVNISGLTVTNVSSSSATQSLFLSTYALSLNLVALQYSSKGPSAPIDLFDVSGSGLYMSSSIAGSTVYAFAGTKTRFTGASSGSVFLNSSISGNVFQRVTNIYGLNAVAYANNSHPGATPNVTFTGAGTFTGNSFPSGAGVITLDGSIAGGNSGAGGGFTGTKTAGNCTITFSAGFVTNVTGC